MLHRAVDTELGIGPKSRNQPKAEELETLLSSLDELGDQVRDQIREALE